MDELFPSDSMSPCCKKPIESVWKAEVSPKQDFEGVWTDVLPVAFKIDQIFTPLPVEPVGNNTRLPVGLRGHS